MAKKQVTPSEEQRKINNGMAKSKKIIEKGRAINAKKSKTR